MWNYSTKGASSLNFQLDLSSLPIPTAGISVAATSPWVWSKGLRGVGNIEQAVRNNPQMFGKFAKTLTDAVASGQQALIATHFILQQQNPEYRATTRAIEEQDEE